MAVQQPLVFVALPVSSLCLVARCWASAHSLELHGGLPAQGCLGCMPLQHLQTALHRILAASSHIPAPLLDMFVLGLPHNKQLFLGIAGLTCVFMTSVVNTQANE